MTPEEKDKALGKVKDKVPEEVPEVPQEPKSKKVKE